MDYIRVIFESCSGICVWVYRRKQRAKLFRIFGPCVTSASIHRRKACVPQTTFLWTEHWASAAALTRFSRARSLVPALFCATEGDENARRFDDDADDASSDVCSTVRDVFTRSSRWGLSLFSRRRRSSMAALLMLLLLLLFYSGELGFSYCHEIPFIV